MKAKSYFSRKSRGTPEKGALGKPSQWLEFVELELKGAKCLVADAAFMPEESEGVVVELAPGRYQIELKGLDFRGDKRVSLLRLLLPGSRPARGQKLGETWTDTARTGVCDHETFYSRYSLNTEASDEQLQKQLDRDGDPDSCRYLGSRSTWRSAPRPSRWTPPAGGVSLKASAPLAPGPPPGCSLIARSLSGTKCSTCSSSRRVAPASNTRNPCCR